MTQPITLPTEIESMGPNDVLTDEQRAAVAAEKDISWDAPVDDKKVNAEPGSDPAKLKEDDKEVVKSAEELEAEAAAKADADAKTAEEKAAQEAVDKAAKEENDRLDKKAKEAGKTVEEVKKLEADEKADVERVEKIAKDEGITVEEVRENEQKDLAIADRHGKDALKLARALRKEQSEYGKAQNELKDLRSLKDKVEAAQLKFNEKQFQERMEAGRDDIVAKYREKFPEDSADLTDEVVFERGKVLIKEGLKVQETQFLSQLKVKATGKRDELIKALPDDFKEFAPEVKKIVAECTDEQVMDKDFSVTYIAEMVRGRKYTSDYVKSLEDAAFKRGAEKAKIIPRVSGGKPNAGSGGSAGGGADLTATQKARAEEVYGRREGWTKEKMWDEYARSDKDKDAAW